MTGAGGGGSIPPMDEGARTVEHLRLIQGVIARMADNSARMKTAAVSLVTAAFVFAGLSDGGHGLVALGAAVAVVALGAMDARYLQLERRYVALYRAAAAGGTRTPFDLDHRPWAGAAGPLRKVALSWSVAFFHGALLAMTALLAILDT